MATSSSSPRFLSLRADYEARLKAGDLKFDSAQSEALAVFEDFASRALEPAPGFWDRLKQKYTGAAPKISGLYLYGDVGRGKSMLMDLFFSSAPIVKKRRVHFHQFMLEVHERLHHLQQIKVDNVLPRVARDIASETRLLCFDEFHVSNIADAMILGRLFTALFDEGVEIVATSNWPPDNLYKNGLQRDRFLPFIELLKQRMMVHRLAGNVDHRFEQMRAYTTCFSPLGDEATRRLQGLFLQFTDNADPESIALPVQGRSLKITHTSRGVGFFNFDELCVAALGAADYLAIAECLHTVLLDGVPKFRADQRNETLRFMTLIDVLYESKVKFFMTAAAPPEKLAPTGDHAFAFQRTVSRLMEMQSDEYRRLAHLG